MDNEKKEDYSGEEVKIDDTLDVLEYAEDLADVAIDAKADDGKIDTAEAVSGAVKTAPKALEAVMGSWNIDDELGNLNDEEKDVLLKKSMSVVLKFTSLFVKLPESK